MIMAGRNATGQMQKLLFDEVTFPAEWFDRFRQGPDAIALLVGAFEAELEALTYDGLLTAMSAGRVVGAGLNGIVAEI